jgi:hypothetical protein
MAKAGNASEETETVEPNGSQKASGEYQESENAKAVPVDIKVTAEETKEGTSASTPKSLKTGTMIIA